LRPGAQVIRVRWSDAPRVIALVNAAVFPYAHQPIETLEFIGMKKERVHHAEDSRVRADAQREREHAHRRESRTLSQGPESISQIRAKSFDPVHPSFVAAFFLYLLHPAKFPQRSPPRFLPRHSRRDVLRNLPLQMKP